MTIHRIDLIEAPKGRATMAYRGETIGTSRQPLFSAARWLIDNDLAEPGDRIETWRGSMRCMSAAVGVAAGLTVKEPDAGGIEVARWTPHPRSLGRSQSGETEAGAATLRPERESAVAPARTTANGYV